MIRRGGQLKMKSESHRGDAEARRNAKAFAADFRRLTLIQNMISNCPLFDLRSSAQICGRLVFSVPPCLRGGC
jgi:hypothetical protein